MVQLQRPLPPNPYDHLPQFPALKVWSDDFTDGGELPKIHSAEGGNISPHLAWSGAPENTASYLITAFDPDAPIPSGYWHWLIADVPANITELAQGMGESDLTLNGAMFHLASDGGAYSYEGAAPPPGDHPHRYMFTVHALSVDTLELEPEDTPAKASFLALFNTIARGTITATYQR